MIFRKKGNNNSIDGASEIIRLTLVIKYIREYELTNTKFQSKKDRIIKKIPRQS